MDAVVPAQRYQRVKELFHAACEMPEARRAEYLEHACAGDEALQQEVAALLRVEVCSTGFLESPVVDGERFLQGAAASFAAGGAGESPAVSIGRYRIVRLIGQGGMGCVYEAEQDLPHRRVAVKVVRGELHSPRLRERFNNEVQILGRLHHKGIAQIYDAGVAAMRRQDGSTASVPYFAMELVDGVPLMDHAVHAGLGNRRRLELLAGVCDAVHYGHLQGVIHRDLKPANILVQASGEAKVIDFGVARATNSDVAITTLQTNAGQILGTLAYMSPEQVSGSPREVDARSDVYSLGVIGYEILSNRLPYDLAGLLVPQAARVIQDAEPSRLSSISRVYRGDIETIIGKAIEKDPARRYQSAAELAADIRRYLNDQPIVARPPTLRYQLTKFAQRHKEFVAALIVVFIVLIAGVVGTSLALVHALGQRTVANNAKADALAAAEVAKSEAERAKVESRKFQRVSQIMQQVLSYAAPGTPGGGRDVKVVQMLDAADELLGQLADAPEVETILRRTLGQTYARLGEDETAQRHYSRAMELTVAAFGRESLEEYDLYAEMALHRVWKPGEADLYAKREVADGVERCLESARGKAPPDHPTIQRLLLAAGVMNAATWRLELSKERRMELLQILQSLPPDRRIVTEIEVKTSLSWPLSSTQSSNEAIQAVREALDSLGNVPPTIALKVRIELLVNLGQLMEGRQELGEAAAAYAESFALQREAQGLEHPGTLATAGLLRGLMLRMNRLPEALAFNTIDRDANERTAPEADWLAYIYAYEGMILSRLGREVEAGASFEKAVTHRRRHFGDDWLAQEWWRAGVASAGELFRPWTSETLRRFLWRHVEHALRLAPTTTFALDELDWNQARFTLERWDGRRRIEIAQGPLEQLREVADPEPGLVRLQIQCPRSGGAELCTGGWLLAAPWRLDLFSSYRSHETIDQLPATPNGPVEHRELPALAIEENYVDPLGPAGAQLSFDIRATAMVQLPSGRYLLRGGFDDGARVWLDDRLLFDGFNIAGRHPGMFETEVDFDVQPRELRVEYFQHGQVAVLWITAKPVLDDSLESAGPTESDRTPEYSPP